MEFRAAGGDEDLGAGYLGLLRIRFSPVNEWTEINSVWEGRFLERFAPGAWKKTIRENAQKIRSLFQHGQDPQIGDKPLGPFRTLEEDDEGGYAEVGLLDTSYNRDLLPGLQEGLYGASHRFRAMREEEVMRPEPSEHNPDGIPERTVKEARLFELGPVTFPAYEGATAGMRSMTDEFLITCFRSDPDRLRDMFERATELGGERADDSTRPLVYAERDDDSETSEDDTSTDETAADDAAADETSDAPSERDAAADEPHLTDERRVPGTTPPPAETRAPLYGTRRKETSKPWLL